MNTKIFRKIWWLLLFILVIFPIFLIIVFVDDSNLSKNLGTNIIGVSGTDLENLSISTSKSISGDIVTLSFDYSIGNSLGNKIIDGMSFNLLFDSSLNPQLNQVINKSSGAIFDNTTFVDLKTGKNANITLYNLAILKNSGGGIFNFSYNIGTFSKHTVNISAQILTTNGNIYDLIPQNYLVSIEPSAVPSVVSPSGGGGGGGGGGGDKVLTKETPKPATKEKPKPATQNTSATTTPAVTPNPKLVVYDICKESYSSPLTDIHGHYAEGAINFLYNNYTIDGYKDGTFKPDQTINRAELTKMTLLTFRYGVSQILTTTFKDVPISQWYAPYISSAKILGIINGYKDGYFRPTNRITRAEALKIILFAAGRVIPHTVTSAFNDISAKDWFYHIANYGYENGIINGTGKNSFSPNKPITRGQAAIILANSVCSVDTPLLKALKEAPYRYFNVSVK